MNLTFLLLEVLNLNIQNISVMFRCCILYTEFSTNEQAN